MGPAIYGIWIHAGRYHMRTAWSSSKAKRTNFVIFHLTSTSTMADKDISIESGSDTGAEKRDYPGNQALFAISSRMANESVVKWYRSTFFNITILGLCNFSAPGIWGAMNSLGAGGAQSPHLVNAGNSLTFCLMVVSCYFSSVIVHYIGIKGALIFGTYVYLVLLTSATLTMAQYRVCSLRCRAVHKQPFRHRMVHLSWLVSVRYLSRCFLDG
jgi:hypothetical protein